MVEQEEEQGARPISRVILGVSVCFGLAAGQSVAPLFFDVLGEVGVFFAAWRGRDYPGGFGHCAEVVDCLVRASDSDRPLIQVGPIFFGGGVFSLLASVYL